MELQVKVGQIYQDNDPRTGRGPDIFNGRRVRVIALNDGTKKALVENISKKYGGLGRQTEISYNRLKMNNARGYRIVG